MIRQIKSTAIIFLVLLVGAPAATCVHLWISGEFAGCSLTHCPELLDTLNHAAFSSTMMAFGWLFMRSPLAGKITEILESRRSPGGEQKITSITVSEPAEEKQ